MHSSPCKSLASILNTSFTSWFLSTDCEIWSQATFTTIHRCQWWAGSTQISLNKPQPGLPRLLSGKEPSCQAGDEHLIHGSGRSLGERNGNPRQYSCMGNPMDREAWQAAVHRVMKELDTTEQLNTTTTSHQPSYHNMLSFQRLIN